MNFPPAYANKMILEELETLGYNAAENKSHTSWTFVNVPVAALQVVLRHDMTNFPPRDPMMYTLDTIKLQYSTTSYRLRFNFSVVSHTHAQWAMLLEQQ